MPIVHLISSNGSKWMMLPYTRFDMTRGEKIIRIGSQQSMKS
jgi:hypothetical protein